MLKTSTLILLLLAVSPLLTLAWEGCDSVAYFDQKITDEALWDFYQQTKGPTQWPPLWRTRWKPTPCAWDGAENHNPAPFGTRCVNGGWHPIAPRGDGGLMYLEHFSGMAEGPVPESFKVFQMVTVIDLHGNKLYGPIWNTSYHNFLHRFDLSNNQFSGTLGNDFMIRCKIHTETVNFANNKFSGTLPRSMPQLVGMIALLLQNNQFEGAIPPMPDLVRMSHLNLANNKFSGTLGDWVGKLKRLSWLELDNNAELEGPLPPTMPERLSYFSAKGTKLSGMIPTSYGNLSRLVHFDCTGCNLECPSPDLLAHVPFSSHCKPAKSYAWSV
eukprot:PhM_4_TR8223/c0_g1_i1/m.5855